MSAFLLVFTLLACGTRAEPPGPSTAPTADPTANPAAALPEPPAATARWEGVPLERLPSLGLEAPTLLDGGPDWQAPFAAGDRRGIVRFTRYESDAMAAGRFATRAGMSATRALPPTSVEGAEEAVGDDQLVLARSGNAVVQVRDPGGRARERAAAVIRELRPAD